MNRKMNDAISRSDMLKKLCMGCSLKARGSEPTCGSPCRDYWDISYMPTMDVQPVVHARWIIEKDKAIFCDECSHKLPIVIYNTKAFDRLAHHLPKYCPECGAKMDAKEKRA